VVAACGFKSQAQVELLVLRKTLSVRMRTRYTANEGFSWQVQAAAAPGAGCIIQTEVCHIISLAGFVKANSPGWLQRVQSNGLLH